MHMYSGEDDTAAKRPDICKLYLGSNKTNVFDQMRLHHLCKQARMGGCSDEAKVPVGGTGRVSSGRNLTVGAMIVVRKKRK